MMTKRQALEKLNSVRSACEGIISERCDPFNNFYKGGSIAFMRTLGDTISNGKFDAKMVNRLLKIRDAIQGMTSEEDDPFHGMIEGGTKAVMDNLDSVLEALGVEILKPEPVAFSYKAKDGSVKWGIAGNKKCVKNPSGWLLTGLSSKEEAEKTMNEDWFKAALVA